MRKRRIWALRVLRDFLDDNRRFSALRQVAKDLMRATRCLQSFVRGFNACTAARMLALTQLWIKVEAEMVSHSEKEIERRFKARRVDIIALTGKTRVCSFDHFIVASFLEDLEREQDEMKRALKVHPVVREKVLSVYLADKRLHFKSTTEEILSGMEDKLRPVLTIDDAKAMISNNENSSGVVGVANQYVDTFSKKRKKRATRLPDATLKMRLYSGTGKACMQNLIRSARNTSISSDRVADRSSRASLLRQRQTLRRPSRPISSSRGTTRISSRPAQPARSFERMSSRPLN